MAGQPKRRALLAALTRLASQEIDPAEDGTPPTATDYAVLWVASGGTLQSLADDHKVRREFLRLALVHDAGGADALNTRLAHARAEAGADALAEESISIVDNALGLDKTGVLASRIKAERRAWLAGCWNRQRYGNQDKGLTVAISLPNLHLDALRVLRVEDTASVASLPASVDTTTDYEIVSQELGASVGVATPPVLPPAQG